MCDVPRWSTSCWDADEDESEEVADSARHQEQGGSNKGCSNGDRSVS